MKLPRGDFNIQALAHIYISVAIFHEIIPGPRTASYHAPNGFYRCVNALITDDAVRARRAISAEYNNIYTYTYAIGLIDEKPLLPTPRRRRRRHRIMRIYAFCTRKIKIFLLFFFFLKTR